jgi:hypothetical protein
VYAVNHDPENLFKGLPVAEGIIERRMMSKQMQTDKQFAAMVTQAQDEDRKKLLLRRQSRTPPTDHIELVEFFLNTQADDMEVRGWGPGVLRHRCVGQAACQAGLVRAGDPTAAGAAAAAPARVSHISYAHCRMMSNTKSALNHLSLVLPCHAHVLPHMQFEVARCRPQLTPEFFKQLDNMVGQVCVPTCSSGTLVLFGSSSSSQAWVPCSCQLHRCCSVVRSSSNPRRSTPSKQGCRACPEYCFSSTL